MTNTFEEFKQKKNTMMNIPTWPMNTTLTCSFSVVVASLTSGLTFVLGFEAGTKVSLSMEFSSSSGVVAGVAPDPAPADFSELSASSQFSTVFSLLGGR